MIDQDKVELPTLKKLKFHPILCAFHLIHTVVKMVKKHCIASDQSEAWTLIKRIWRSGRGLWTTKQAISDFKKFCNEDERRGTLLEKMEAFFLTKDGLKCWLDKYRKNNDGLFNTNNFSEAIFRHILPGKYKKNLMLWEVRTLCLLIFPHSVY